MAPILAPLLALIAGWWHALPLPLRIVGSLGGIAVVLAALAHLLARRTGIGAATTVLANDTDRAASETLELRDTAMGLVGKPDYLVEETVRGHRQIVAIELKPERRARAPYLADQLQVTTYMILLRQRYGERAAPYGRLRYATGEFVIAWDDRLVQQVLSTAESIRAARRAPAAGVTRTHADPRRCATCAVRAQCDQRLG